MHTEEPLWIQFSISSISHFYIFTLKSHFLDIYRYQVQSLRRGMKLLTNSGTHKERMEIKFCKGTTNSLNSF